MTKKYSLKVIPSHEITDAQLASMHNLYMGYYNGVNLEQFKSDIKQSRQCVLATEIPTNKIIGFIGQHILETPYKNKNIVVFCGGKTISDRSYWGTHLTNNLQMVWIKEMFKHYLTHISKPHYMYFSPTGYKTYLLLTNNSIKYWPCWNKANQDLAEIANFVSEYMYGNDYDKTTKLVDFKQHYALKEDVAEITDEKMKNPKIALFAKMNPSWKQGTGLPSIAQIDLLTLLKMMLKKIHRSMFKTVRKNSQG